MRIYKFEVVVIEGSDEFWEEATANGNSGCDDVKQEVLEAITEKFFDSTVELIEYKNDRK